MDEVGDWLEIDATVAEIVRGWIAVDPRRLSDVTNHLLSEQCLPQSFLEKFALGDSGTPEAKLDREELERFVLDALLYDDRVWRTGHDDPWLALTDALADEMVLTHRLEEPEVREGHIPIVPDLVALDCRVRDRLEVPGIGRLRIAPGPDARRPGHDNSALSGPEGWLGDLRAGDLVMFRRRGKEVTIARAESPVPDDNVVAQLKDAATWRLRGDRGEEAFPMVLDAMTTDAGAFRHPVRPLSELLTDAGLERRGFSWGLRGQRWVDAAEGARRLARRLAARQYGFDQCCLQAYDRVLAAASDRDGSPRDRLGEDLCHGDVASAVFTHVLRFPFDEDATGHPSGDGINEDRRTRLVALASQLATGRRPHSAAGHYVLALDAGGRGEALLASSHLQQALEDDPGYKPAARESVRYKIHGGDLEAALYLLQRTEASLPPPSDGYLRMMHYQLVVPFRGAGRNQPCPCGSSQKFKACCARSPKISPRMRGALLDLKLDLFIRDNHDDEVLTVAIAAGGSNEDRFDEVSSPLFNPVVPDFLAFEGGLAKKYLELRGELRYTTPSPQIRRRLAPPCSGASFGSTSPATPSASRSRCPHPSAARSGNSWPMPRPPSSSPAGTETSRLTPMSKAETGTCVVVRGRAAEAGRC